MIARDDIRPEFKGWTVYGTVTGSPASINDALVTRLEFGDADDLADLLNNLQSQQSSTAAH
jgi:hypothetical protein